MENWQRHFSNTNDWPVLFCFFNRCLPKLGLVLRFSKCASVSSDRMLTCPSKHTLFLHSRCQSYFLVPSHNGPVKLCQACFLCSSVFALWFNFMHICLFCEYGFEILMWSHWACRTTTGGKLVLAVLSMMTLSSFCTILFHKVSLGFRFVSSGQQRE